MNKTYVPDLTPNDAQEWLAQVHRKREELEVAIGSMVGAPEVSNMLDFIEAMCRRVAVKKAAR